MLAMSNFERYHRLRETLSEWDRNETDILVGKATGYVWGWQDAGGRRKGAAGDPDDSWEFGYAYGVYVAEYYAELRSGMTCIRTAFLRWLDGQPLDEYPARERVTA